MQEIESLTEKEKAIICRVIVAIRNHSVSAVALYGKNGYIDGVINDPMLYSEDELRIIRPADADVRQRGAGAVELLYKNAYIYRVRAIIDSYNEGNGNIHKRSRKDEKDH